ncbi:MAG TPA: MarR family transcriptional regulator [Frankiaceae bacterium]|jgi:DNA-binding MarR family transcriptional regulator|nr:MarR family transcriptional regulator [Frankiaceae bacterium]
MPRWLSVQEQAAWRSSLSAVQLLNAAVDSQLQRESNLSHADYEILVRLSEEPKNALRMSELAHRALFSRSRLSHAVGRLEKAGLVRREPYPDDRRGLCAVLTERGFETLAAAAPGHVETVRRAVFDRLTAEQVAQLTAIAEAVIAGISPPPAAG